MVKERETINTNIRLNLANPDDREAWEHLQRMDRKKYKSYSRAVVIAVNDYFRRAELAETDPYLETREKEDAFLQSVLDAVEKGAMDAMPMVILNTLIGLLQSAAGNGQIAANPQPVASSKDDESSGSDKQEASLDDALSFVDNF
ncbi:MAG: hypothetical protein IJP78_10215 [Clostridia bacterium]|nr:hypothetical protein [Clostridia bacterium]MBQ6961337.1 hypothetical protein [Clostridia bacterium]